MMTIDELQDKWNLISPYSGGYLLVSGDHPLSFHIGYRGNEQKSFVVLNTGKIDDIVSSKAISVECIQTDNGCFALRFSLSYPSLDEIFIKLCWDLIDSSRYAANPIQKIIDQYSSWRRLLQQVGNGLLSASQQKGLIGELLYFRDTIEMRPPDQVINAWVGPEGGDQDFVFADHWAEIKAVSISANEVEISSLQQLDRNDTGFLIVYFLDRTTSAGLRTLSLPEVILQIRNKFQGSSDLDEFNCKLAKYGFLGKDLDKYQEVRYRLAEKRKYSVDEAFPRLTRNTVPVAIASAKYGISFSAVESNRIQED